MYCTNHNCSLTHSLASYRLAQNEISSSSELLSSLQKQFGIRRSSSDNSSSDNSATLSPVRAGSAIDNSSPVCTCERTPSPTASDTQGSLVSTDLLHEQPTSDARNEYPSDRSISTVSKSLGLLPTISALNLNWSDRDVLR